MARNINGSKDGDIIEPSGGKTKLAGGRGDDRYIVKDADTLVIERNNGGTDTVEAWLDYALTDEVENLELHGPDALKGNGNSLDNRLSGNEWDNQLFGLQGDDELYGAGGNDVLEGGDGFDTAVFDGSSSDYQIEVQDDFIYVRYAPDGEIISTDTLKSVEMLAFEDGTILVSDLQADPSPTDIPAGPIAEADYADFDEDTEIVIDLLANDSGSNLAIMSIGTAQMGEVSLEAGGLVRYTPFPDAFGQDSFDYTVIDEFGNTSTSTVTLEVLPVNDAPEATGEAFEIDGSIPYESIDSLLDNDFDPDGDTLSILSYDTITANGGTVSINEDGYFTYSAPSPLDVTGTPSTEDVFNYVVTDAYGAEASATVQLNLSPATGQTPADDTITSSSEAPAYAIDSLIPGDFLEAQLRWNADSAIGSEVTITYSFLDAVPDYYGANAAERTGFDAMSAEQESVVREALDQIASFTDITFIKAASGIGDLTFGTADLPSGSGWAYGPSTTALGGDVWIDNSVSANFELAPGEDGYKTIFHEIGHALGLEHPHEGDLLPDEEMTRSFTLMSYSSPDGSGGIEPSTYMMYDVAALQYLYGTDTTSTSGDDVYDVSNAQDLVMTIWDSGGHDTLSAEGSTEDVVLDLNPGSFSTSGEAYGFYGMTNNIAIAYGSHIEAAIGGLGNDILIGSAEDNELTGGAGQDSYVMGSNWGSDVITDFEDGNDKIDLSSLGITFEDLILKDENGQAIILYDEDRLTLNDLTSSDLNEDDFFFGPMA